MNLKRLQAFRAVFEAASVTQAAERLHTTQPAVSRLIGDLEAELGLTLFVRQRRRLVPTAEGRAFYRDAEKALAAVDQIVDIARDIRTLRGAHLRVVVPMLIAFGILPAAVGAFSRAHPHTRVSLDIKDIRDIADWVADGPFDIGVTALPFEDARVECEPIATVRTVLVMPGRHPLVAKRLVNARDLHGESMILPLGDPPRSQVCAPLEAAGLKIESITETSSALLACQLRRGLGSACSIPSPSNWRPASASSRDRSGPHPSSYSVCSSHAIGLAPRSSMHSWARYVRCSARPVFLGI